MAELSTLARPYARAAFEHAVAADHLQEWSDSLRTAATVVVQPLVVGLLSSPSTTGAEQSAAVVEICGDTLGAELQNFVVILSENRRIQLLPQIAHCASASIKVPGSHRPSPIRKLTQSEYG